MRLGEGSPGTRVDTQETGELKASNWLTLDVAIFADAETRLSSLSKLTNCHVISSL